MEIQFRLSNVGYFEAIPEQVFKDGPPDVNFINLIAWLNSELVKLCKLESFVSRDTNAEDSLSFFVEVSSLLKELSCPYKCLTKRNISERLILPEHKKLLITYLCTELEAAKIQTFKKPPKKSAPVKVELYESKTAKELEKMLDCLHLKPPATIAIQQIFDIIENKLKDLSQPSTPKEVVGCLLFTGCLTEKQWFNLEYLYNEMYQEYKVRRNLLLTRLEVTIKSFTWSIRLEEKFEKIMTIYEKYRSGILLEPMVKISDILAAKPSLALIEKTSSIAVRRNTKSSVNNVLIGDVPDRGGRPEEQQPPPPEVPSWQKNYSSSQRSKFSSPPSSNRGRENTNCNRNYSAPNEHSNSHASMSYFSTKDDIPRNNKGLRSGSRGAFAAAVNQSVYQPVYQSTYNPAYECVYQNTYLGSPELGFGGYMHAGNNYQHYGIGDNQINQRGHDQTRAAFHRSGLSKRRGRSAHSY